MIRKLLTCLLIVTALKSSAQTKNCSDFRTGAFEYTDKKYENYKVFRTDSTQVETGKNGFRAEGSIKWISDCEYVLTYNKLSSDENRLLGKKIMVTILSVEGNKYTFHSKMDSIEITTELAKVQSK